MDYSIRLYELLCAQDNVRPIELDAVRAAHTRQEIGLTSLGIIMLVAGYLESRGLPDDMFDPEWINDFETVQGIQRVLQIIDERAAK